MGTYQNQDQFIGERGWGWDLKIGWGLMLVMVIVRVMMVMGGEKVKVGDGVKVTVPIRVKPVGGIWYKNLYFVIDKSVFEGRQGRNLVGYKVELEGRVTSQIKRGVFGNVYRVKGLKVNIKEKLWLFWVWQEGEKLRKVLLGKIEDLMPWPESALLKGLLFGTKEDLGEYEKYLKRTGTIHTVAASGFNVMVVFGVVFYGALMLIPRRQALLISLVLIWLYGIIAGLSPPVVRAVVMGSLMILAYGSGGGYKGFYSLAVGISLILLVRPEFIFSISFQLSVLATIGIMGLGGWVKHKIGWLGEDIGLTIAAQLMTWPVLMFYFGQFNLVSFIANGLILWTVPVLTIGGFVMLGLAGINDGLAGILAGGLWGLEKYFLLMVKWLAGVKGFLLTQRLNLGLIWAYYLFIIGFYWKQYKRWISSG